MLDKALEIIGPENSLHDRYSGAHWPDLERLRMDFTPTCSRPDLQGPGYQPERASHTFDSAVELQLVGFSL